MAKRSNTLSNNIESSTSTSPRHFSTSSSSICINNSIKTFWQMHSKMLEQHNRIHQIYSGPWKFRVQNLRQKQSPWKITNFTNCQRILPNHLNQGAATDGYHDSGLVNRIKQKSMPRSMWLSNSWCHNSQPTMIMAINIFVEVFNTIAHICFWIHTNLLRPFLGTSLIHSLFWTFPGTLALEGVAESCRKKL